MQTRAFNQVKVDYQRKILTKTSTNKAKLENEINFYLDLPANISRLFPRLLNYEKDFSCYQIEFIPNKNLAQLWLSQQLTLTESQIILAKLVKILSQFHRSGSAIKATNLSIQNFYIEKTCERIEQLAENNYFKTLLALPSLTINQTVHENFNGLKDQFVTAIQQLINQNSSIAIIHGDFCFSNILYCIDKKDFKLIDPRGAFGRKGIYGHTYYDYAKLLHCLHGRYDYIMNNRFELITYAQGNYQLTLPTDPLLDQLTLDYHQLLTEQGIVLNTVYLIEASLFLSMAALHYDNFERQKALFLTGIIILNRFFKGEYANLH